MGRDTIRHGKVKKARLKIELMGKTTPIRSFSNQDPNHATTKKKATFFFLLFLSSYRKLNHKTKITDIIYKTQVRQTPNEKEKAGSSISLSNSLSSVYSAARGTDSA